MYYICPVKLEDLTVNKGFVVIKKITRQALFDFVRHVVIGGKDGKVPNIVEIFKQPKRERTTH